jgi:hypothetical protein
MRILRGLTSRLLPCGCVAGVYETYEGQVVTLLDEREPACRVPEHTEGDELRDMADMPGAATQPPPPAPRSPRRG